MASQRTDTDVVVMGTIAGFSKGCHEITSMLRKDPSGFMHDGWEGVISDRNPPRETKRLNEGRGSGHCCCYCLLGRLGGPELRDEIERIAEFIKETNSERCFA